MLKDCFYPLWGRITLYHLYSVFIKPKSKTDNDISARKEKEKGLNQDIKEYFSVILNE